jgi:hypothetical protein
LSLQNVAASTGTQMVMIARTHLFQQNAAASTNRMVIVMPVHLFISTTATSNKIKGIVMVGLRNTKWILEPQVPV